MSAAAAPPAALSQPQGAAPEEGGEEREEEEERRAAKRARTGGDERGGGGGDVAEQHQQQQREQQVEEQGEDQVAAALLRIRGHIGSGAKFLKASSLLRRLLQTGSLGGGHRHLLFAAVGAAFEDVRHTQEPGFRKEYGRLMSELSACQQLLSKKQQAQVH